MKIEICKNADTWYANSINHGYFSFLEKDWVGSGAARHNWKSRRELIAFLKTRYKMYKIWHRKIDRYNADNSMYKVVKKALGSSDGRAAV